MSVPYYKRIRIALLIETEAGCRAMMLTLSLVWLVAMMAAAVEFSQETLLNLVSGLLLNLVMAGILGRSFAWAMAGYRGGGA